MNLFELTLSLSSDELADRLGCKTSDLDEHDDEELWGLIRDFGTVVDYGESPVLAEVK